MNRASLLLSLLLAAPLIAPAQTNTPDLAPPSANATTTTSAPANATPPPPNPPTPPDQADPARQDEIDAVTFDKNGNAHPAQATATQQDEIADIRPPYFFSHPWFWLAIALATLLALLALLWPLFKPHRLFTAQSVYDLTLEKLEKARAIMREDNPMPYTVLITEAVRSYVAHRFETPFTRRTTEEFLRQMETDPNTPLAGHRLLLWDFLKRCDLVKFARYQPTLAELDLVYQHALKFVTATKPLPAPRNGSSP